MNKKLKLTNPSRIIILLILSTVSLNSFAVAPSCIALFEKSKPSTLNEKAALFLDALENANWELIDFLETKQDQIVNQETIQHFIDKIDKASVDYFTVSKISYEITKITDQNVNAFNARIPTLTHSVYTLTGSQTGDLNSKFINGVNKNKKLGSLKIKFTPLRILTNPMNAGAYTKAILGEDANINFAFPLLVYRIQGKIDPLRHEVKHAFEAAKRDRGEQTLASFQVRNSQVSNKPYGMFLSFDEIETYLRDLRYLKNISPRLDKFSKNEKYLNALDADILKEIADKAELLSRFIHEGKVVLTEIQERIIADDRTHQTSSPFGNIQIKFSDLKNGFYDQLVFTEKLGEDRDADYEKTLLARITWAQKRILQIETELNKISGI
ncbi:MAG: hypothetical protein WA160_14400 [Pseudobdellovibrio sp.]